MKRDHRWRPILKLSDKPTQATFSKQIQEDKQVKKHYEGALKELEEKKETNEKLRLKTKEVHQEAQNEKILLASEENKMNLHYESKMKILDIKVIQRFVPILWPLKHTVWCLSRAFISTDVILRFPKPNGRMKNWNKNNFPWRNKENVNPSKISKISYFKISFPEICLTGTLLMHPIPSRDTTVQVLIESLTIFGI